MNLSFSLPGLLALPLLLVVPGWVTARVWFRDPDALEPSERLFIPVAASVLLITWFGLVLAEFGRFSLPALVAVSTLYSVLVSVIGWRRDGPGRLYTSVRWFSGLRPNWVFLAIILLGAALAVPPAEYILGNYDSGVYVNVAASIAHTGAIAIHDPMVQSLAPDPSRQFFLDLINPFMLFKQLRVPGFFVADQATGLVLPQFLHLYPVWLAVFISALGLKLGLYATPLLGVLSSIAAYLVARQLLGRRLALLALFLLVVDVPQFWFARYPVAEMMTQFLMLTGMYAFLRSRDLAFRADGVPGVGLPLLAALAFVGIFTTRADSILILAPIGLYAVLVILSRRWTRGHWAFFGAFALLFGHALAHMWFFSPDYVYFQYTHFLRMKNFDKLLPGGGLPEAADFFQQPLLFAGLIAAAAIGGLIALFALDRVVQFAVRRRASTWVAPARRGLPVMRVSALVVLVAAFGFAYFIWPHPTSLLAFIGGETTASRAGNLIKLGWYLSPIGLALAVLGGAIVLLRDLNRHNAFFYGTAALFTVFFLEELYSNPHYIYTTRHYVPLVIPLLIFLAARGLGFLWSELGPRAAAIAPGAAADAAGPRPRGGFALNPERVERVGRFAAAAALALWLVYNVYAMGLFDFTRASGLALRLPLTAASVQAGPVRLDPFDQSIVGFHELEGAIDEIDRLAAQLDPNAVILFSNNRDEPSLMATPLRLIYGRDPLVARFNQPNGDKIAAMIDTWRAQGRPVVIALGTNGGKLSVPRYTLEPFGRYTLQFPQWAFSYQYMPRAAWTVSLSYTLYRVSPGAALASYPYTVRFDADDYPALVRGFLERKPDEQTRWIGVIPALDGNSTPKGLGAALRLPLSGQGDTVYLSLTARAPKDGMKLSLKSGKNNSGDCALARGWTECRFALARERLNREGDTFILDVTTGVFDDHLGRLLGAELEQVTVSDREIAGGQ